MSYMGMSFLLLSMKYQVFYGATGFLVCVLSLSILPVLEQYAALPFSHRRVIYITDVALSDLIFRFDTTKLSSQEKFQTDAAPSRPGELTVETESPTIEIKRDIKRGIV